MKAVSVCLQGLGTTDSVLIRIMVARAEIDMLDIKAEFLKMYGKTLYSFIKVGDWKIHLFLCLIAEHFYKSPAVIFFCHIFSVIVLMVFILSRWSSSLVLSGRHVRRLPQNPSGAVWRRVNIWPCSDHTINFSSLIFTPCLDISLTAVPCFTIYTN